MDDLERERALRRDLRETDASADESPISQPPVGAGNACGRRAQACPVVVIVPARDALVRVLDVDDLSTERLEP
jgi:hypothetical protein